MNWLVYAIAAWVCLGLEIGLRDGLSVGYGRSAPSFMFAFATFIALFATPTTALWSSLMLGLLVDLSSEIVLADGRQAAVVIGPHALGFLLAGQLTLTLRGVMVRRNPLTLGFLALVSGIVAQVLVVAFYSVRAAYDPVSVVPWQLLLSRLGTALFTAPLAMVLGLALVPMAPIFGLPAALQRRFARRQ